MQLKRVRLLLAATIAICIYETGGVTPRETTHTFSSTGIINEEKSVNSVDKRSFRRMKDQKKRPMRMTEKRTSPNTN